MEKTYMGLSLLFRNYFFLMADKENLRHNVDYEVKRDKDKLGFPIFHITCLDEDTDRLMQKCLDVENGYER